MGIGRNVSVNDDLSLAGITRAARKTIKAGRIVAS